MNADSTGSAGLTSMRWHELALQRWFHTNFVVTEGYPVPVVFTAPMDAFAHFQQLWASSNNPFSYLLEAKDEHGTPLYRPHPEPAKYPLIAISRKGWNMRSTQTYSIHRARHLAWPTYSDQPAREDLGRVLTVRRPMAWDFKFQVDFFSLRPDTQAMFLQTLMSKFWMTGGATPRAFVRIDYPSYYGTQFVQMTLDNSAVENTTPETPADDAVPEYRTTFNLTVEGWVPDFTLFEFPALWTLLLRGKIVPSPGQLAELFTLRQIDLRIGASVPAPILYERPDVPLPA